MLSRRIVPFAAIVYALQTHVRADDSDFRRTPLVSDIHALRASRHFQRLNVETGNAARWVDTNASWLLGYDLRERVLIRIPGVEQVLQEHILLPQARVLALPRLKLRALRLARQFHLGPDLVQVLEIGTPRRCEFVEGRGCPHFLQRPAGSREVSSCGCKRIRGHCMPKEGTWRPNDESSAARRAARGALTLMLCHRHAAREPQQPAPEPRRRQLAVRRQGQGDLPWAS